MTDISSLPPEASDNEPQATPDRSFEDFTLAEAVGQMRRMPAATLRALRQVARAPRGATAAPVALTPAVRAPVQRRQKGRAQPVPDAQRREAALFGLRMTAFLVAWWGAGILANTPLRSEEVALAAGAPFLLGGFLIWLGSELYADWPEIQRRRAQRRQAAEASSAADAVDVPADAAQPEPVVAEQPPPDSPAFPAWAGLHPARVMTGLAAVLLSLLALVFTANNQFTFIGFWGWIASIVLWVTTLAPQDNGPLVWVRGALVAVRGIRWRSGVVLALLAILLLGAWFRLSALDTVPPEMTSDHVEKILDSHGVQQGQHNVFFANNGGREPFQMYAMALFAQLPGLGMNHYTLKLLSVLEGLISIVALFWMGREIVGQENRRFGNLVGLLLAALVAASYWHTVLSRLGLRIVLTTLVTAALLIFLARAMRHNRRIDFIKAGLVLGFGLYAYQAVRMLPVVVTVGVGLAFLFHARTWLDRRRYLLNFGVLVLVAFVVFVPLFGYWLQYPQDFWRRTQGRLLGDDLIVTTDAAGNLVERSATVQERLQAFSENMPILANNLRTALLMFNWKGDVAWINGDPNAPAMDVFTGALLIVGLAAWLARMLRRRDVFDWLVPLALLIMLLPSALSIAYPVENPSHTRTSGALPEAYLIAALPLALMVQSIVRMAPGTRGRVASVGLAVVVLLGAYSQNSHTYFVGHHEAYIESSLPYTEAGRVLRGFADSTGSYGNAFMIGFSYWWDHRALGIEAGRPDWPNGIISADNLKEFLRIAAQRTDAYQLDPDRDLMFFFATEDENTQAILAQHFPQGRTVIRQSYQPDDTYNLYLVPALGADGFLRWLMEAG